MPILDLTACKYSPRAEAEPAPPPPDADVTGHSLRYAVTWKPGGNKPKVVYVGDPAGDLHSAPLGARTDPLQ